MFQLRVGLDGHACEARSSLDQGLLHVLVVVRDLSARWRVEGGRVEGGRGGSLRMALVETRSCARS